MIAPRSADAVLAEALGVALPRAAQLRRSLGAGEEWGALDAQLKAMAATADVEALRDLDDEDIAALASAERPVEALRMLVEGRADRTLRARLAAHTSWAVTEDRSARTRPARDALMAKFERQVDPEGRLTPEERAIRAAHARKAHFLRLAYKSAKVRRERKAAQ